jgi:hypothetical protein
MTRSKSKKVNVKVKVEVDLKVGSKVQGAGEEQRTREPGGRPILDSRDVHDGR